MNGPEIFWLWLAGNLLVMAGLYAAARWSIHRDSKTPAKGEDE